MIAWVVDAAKASSLERVFVSTDDQEIAAVAYGLGAEVKIRAPELSGDKDASELALLDVVNAYPGFDAVVMLQCTSPMTRPEDIDACLDALAEHDCCFSVQETTALIWDAQGSLNHDFHSRPMRQDRIQYEETGAIYAMRMGGFLKHRYRFFGDMAFHVTPRNVDINDMVDFEIAEAML